MSYNFAIKWKSHIVISSRKKRYGMSSDEDEFVDKFERGELADDQDYFDGAW